MPINTHQIYSREATVYLVKGEHKLDTFLKTVEQSQFIKHVLDKWENSGKSRDDFLIAIKPNIMTASTHEVDSPVYTDPELVEKLIQLLREEGFTRFSVVEAPNVFSYSYTGRTVAAVADFCGYSGEGYDIVDLGDDTVEFDYGGVLGKHSIGRTWFEADYRISFAKNKSHWQCFYTACLKNVYGCLPKWDKMKHYHGKNIEFFQATVLIADKLPVDFGFLDAWTSGDGLTGHVRDPKPNLTRTFFASENIYALDWVAGEKMGLNPADNYVIQAAMNLWGPVRAVPQGDMTVWYPWRNIRPFVIKMLNFLEECYWFSRFMSRAMANKMDARFPPVKQCQWFFGTTQTLTRWFEPVLEWLTTKKTKPQSG